MDNRPIGIFDSGLRTNRLGQYMNFSTKTLYFGDSGRTPYGPIKEAVVNTHFRI